MRWKTSKKFPCKVGGQKKCMKKMELRLTSITPRPNHMHFLNIKGACMQFFGRRTKRYELDLYLKTSSLPIGFLRNSLKTFYSLLTSKSFRDYFFL